MTLSYGTQKLCSILTLSGYVDISANTSSITFSVATTPLVDSYNLVATQFIYSLYAHSYDGYGYANAYTQYLNNLLAAFPNATAVSDPCGFVQSEIFLVTYFSLGCTFLCLPKCHCQWCFSCYRLLQCHQNSIFPSRKLHSFSMHLQRSLSTCFIGYFGI